MNILNTINRVFTTKIIYYKGAFILYRKFLTKRSNKVQIKMIYLINLITYLKTDEVYTLDSKTILKSIIIDYKKTIDGLNNQTKIN